jgi:hypothetical protein
MNAWKKVQLFAPHRDCARRWDLARLHARASSWRLHIRTEPLQCAPLTATRTTERGARRACMHAHNPLPCVY